MLQARDDPRAFAPLYDRYADAIFRYCDRRLGNRQAAEDATSLIFTRALAGLCTFHGGSARSWLFAIAEDAYPNLQRDADGAATNTGSDPIELYLTTVESSSGGTPAP